MENSAMIIIKINFNNKSFPTAANPNTPLNTFLVTVLQSFKLNPSQYTLKHQATPILLTDLRPISVLLKGKGASLVFTLKQNDSKSSLTPMLIPTSTVVKIENASNQQVIANLINNFLMMKQLNQCNITRDPNSSVIRLTLPTKQIAVEFIQYLSQMKQTNAQVKNLKASVEQPPLTATQPTQPFQSHISSNQMNPKANQPFPNHPQNNQDSLRNSRSVTLPSIRNERYDTGTGKCQTISSEVDRSNRKLIKKYYAQQEFIRNSSPYVDEEEKRLQEYHQNKKKWLVNDGFLTSVGKYNMKSNRFIPNYVNLTPSESPLNHRFREIKKNHWIDKQGFLVC